MITMTAFTTLCCPKLSFRPAFFPFSLSFFRLRRLLGVTTLLLLAASPLLARAEGIQVKSAELTLVDEVYHLNADLDISLSQTLEDALKKGVPLHFVVEFDLERPRSSWAPEAFRPYLSWSDESIASVEQHLKLSYNALIRQYQLDKGAQQETFASLAEAMQELATLREWAVLDRSLLKKRYTYEAGLRMRLDISQLPKPLQVNAIASKNWNLESDWYHWTLKP
jgi:hypothetical protein